MSFLFSFSSVYFETSISHAIHASCIKPCRRVNTIHFRRPLSFESKKEKKKRLQVHKKHVDGVTVLGKVPGLRPNPSILFNKCFSRCVSSGKPKKTWFCCCFAKLTSCRSEEDVLNVSGRLRRLGLQGGRVRRNLRGVVPRSRRGGGRAATARPAHLWAVPR